MMMQYNALSLRRDTELFRSLVHIYTQKACETKCKQLVNLGEESTECSYTCNVSVSLKLYQIKHYSNVDSDTLIDLSTDGCLHGMS